MWDYWWIKWHWGRVLLKYIGFPLSVLFCQSSVLIFYSTVYDLSNWQPDTLNNLFPIYEHFEGNWWLKQKQCRRRHNYSTILCYYFLMRHSVPDEMENRLHAGSSPSITVLADRTVWILFPVRWDVICRSLSCVAVWRVPKPANCIKSSSGFPRFLGGEDTGL
jgi:hypothetical protein